MQQLIIFCGQYLIIAPVVIFLAYLFILPGYKRVRATVVLIVAGVASYIAAYIAGALYFDPRPFVVGNFTPLIAHAPNNGFPSDHALLASLIAFVVFYYNKQVGIALFVLTLIIGAARVLGGIHHIIDIAGSIVITGVAVWLTYRTLRSHFFSHMS